MRVLRVLEVTMRDGNLPYSSPPHCWNETVVLEVTMRDGNVGL